MLAEFQDDDPSLQDDSSVLPTALLRPTATRTVDDHRAHDLELRPLPSIGITRLQQYYWPLRDILGPVFPSRVSGWPCDRPPRNPSRVAPVFLFYACHRHYPGGIPGCTHRSLPQRRQPSPNYRRVGFRIPIFEACSTFTLITACMLAWSPSDPLHRRLQPLLPVLLLRLLPAGAIVCRAGFAPAGRPCLRTAHGKTVGKSKFESSKFESRKRGEWRSRTRKSRP